MENTKSDNLNKQIALIVTTVAVFTTAFMGSSVTVALPTIGKDFAMDAVLLGWVVTVYPLASAALLVPFGRLADIYGRKKIFTYGLLAYTVSALLSAISTSGAMLITFRVLQGVGAAMLFTTTVAILTSVYPPGDRGRVLGINVASVYLGLSLGPFLGGLLTEHFGWRSIFWITVIMCLVIIPFVFQKMKGEWAEAKGARFDLGGSVLYSLTLVALIYGLSLLPALLGIWLILAGIIGGIAFTRWETKTPSPILNMNLFKNNATFAFSNVAALINYSATFAVTFLLSLYLQYTRGLNPGSAGLILVAMPAVQTVFSPVAGKLSDRIEPRTLASAGMALTTLGLGLLITLEENTSIAFILTSLGILGFGFALFSSPNTNAVMGSVDKKYYGVASATLAAMRQIGFTLSMGIAMLILAAYVGRVEITPEYYGAVLSSAKIAFIVFTALCFGGIFASLARGKVKR